MEKTWDFYFRNLAVVLNYSDELCQEFKTK